MFISYSIRGFIPFPKKPAVQPDDFQADLIWRDGTSNACHYDKNWVSIDRSGVAALPSNVDVRSFWKPRDRTTVVFERKKKTSNFFSSIFVIKALNPDRYSA
jgi:hypothetical protein